MNTKKSPNLEVRYRVYRDSDAEAVRELFDRAITVGGDSLMMVALRAQFSSRSALALYLMTGLGAFLARSPTTHIVYLGSFLSLLGPATFAFLLYARFAGYRYFVGHARKTDLKDVPKAYGLTRKGEKGEYIADGPNGFWIAEVYDAEGMHSEVVGCTGLDVSQVNNAQNTAIELRRMAVSSKYRRRGIASRLINIAVAHARAHGKEYIDLTTSSFQESTLSFYETHGWVIRRRWVLMGVNFYTHQLRRYLK